MILYQKIEYCMNYIYIYISISWKHNDENIINKVIILIVTINAVTS